MKALVLRYLAATGRNADAGAPVETLVTEVWGLHRDFWREHDPDGDRFGTPIPLWGCALGILAVAAALYFVLH